MAGNNSSKMSETLPNFLCDTWWFGLTQRLSDKKFEDLAKLRVKQGFSAIQLVVGIPPEVGPENSNASSEVGPAWDLNGEFNKEYLKHTTNKIELLNRLGLSVLIYGAWGHQIEWLGEERMRDWWKEIIANTEDLDVMYCITGESDIWVGEEDKLLPDKSTSDLNLYQILPFLHPRIVYMGGRLYRLIKKPINQIRLEKRREKWSNILSFVSSQTRKPIFVHVLGGENSEEVVENPELLRAVTVQTGHDTQSKQLLWRLPGELSMKFQKPYINLEPWYEGINNQFKAKDQLFAYWASMMAGASAYCYGAHGIWNVGDGRFLSHWGKQTFDQAVKLDTPRLLGISHRLFIGSGFLDYEQVDIQEKNGKLIQITRANSHGNSVTFIPDIGLVRKVSSGEVFLPLKGEFVEHIPKSGPVIIRN